MPSSYEIEFLPEGRTVKLYGSAGLHYLWPDVTRVRMYTVPVWCLRCDGLHEGERVEPLAEIAKDMAELQDPNCPAYHWFSGPGRRHVLKELVLRRRWRAERVSPARCVDCGSSDILVLLSDQPVVHPSRPLTIVARHGGHCVVSHTDWAFTPEGERIAGGRP